ncbi:unnamed protein product [Paramecium sonneborni]|uniref:Uncharacterized protein n=1 Tax=Paramecium sonneborni TaxID=65129 RepID=A0A8S1R0D3_9CILI|nr:unnamed protein product [Paramecium sonneborni]
MFELCAIVGFDRDRQNLIWICYQKMNMNQKYQKYILVILKSLQQFHIQFNNVFLKDSLHYILMRINQYTLQN